MDQEGRAAPHRRRHYRGGREAGPRRGRRGPHGERTLAADRAKFDKRGARAGETIQAWCIDPATNGVVVTAKPGAEAQARKFAKDSGVGEITVETSGRHGFGLATFFATAMRFCGRGTTATTIDHVRNVCIECSFRFNYCDITFIDVNLSTLVIRW
ncbi:S1 family peptidase [Actinoplanes sp. Pm04-4]|uniref:S1 family peptidase n=1 Tax=Paractinoplanes pyxinae TaxID=2997416 RepID=A0ABT4BBA8_9ACTN|nr:S1 family peptidase [Actinoplanes pyxinae]MCY1143761.1 S1 family peptidase [Actinoplanes pyxinae]